MMLVGAAIAPRRTFRAFLRGRRSRSFYRAAYEPLLASTVREARALAEVPVTAPQPRISDAVLFGASLLDGLVGFASAATLLVPLAPFGILAGALAKRQVDASAT